MSKRATEEKKTTEKTEKKLNISDIIPTKYLSAFEIKDGQILTIRDIDQVEVMNPRTGQRDKRTAIYFESFEKPMIVNRTSLRRLAVRFGSDLPAWINKKVIASVRQQNVMGEDRLVVYLTPLASE
ncbi:MAG: hypothetical protein QW575_06290 [Thermoproteota archaeon]